MPASMRAAATTLPPLVGHFAKGEDLTFVTLPDETTRALGNYVGAIAVNRAKIWSA